MFFVSYWYFFVVGKDFSKACEQSLLLFLSFIHLLCSCCFLLTRSPLIYKPSPSGTAPNERSNNNDNKPKNYNSTSGSGRYNEV